MAEVGENNEENISEADNVLPASEEPLTEEKTNADETNEADITEEKEEGEQEEEPSPPEYTLEIASEDIEQFLSNLPSVSGETETEKTTDTTEESGEAEAAPSLVIPDFIETYLDLFEEKLAILESSSADTKVKGFQLPDDNPVFFKIIGEFSNLYRKLSALIILKSKDGPLINRIDEIQHRSMCYLADELKNLILESRNVDQPDAKEEVAVTVTDENTGDETNEDQPSEEKETESAEYSDQVLSNMNRIAMEMIHGGHGMECCEVYMLCRRHVIGETLKDLGIDKVSIDEAHKMQWELLERDIPRWIATFKQCANVHFPAERKLVDTIFVGHRSLSHPMITNLVRCLFIQFLNFPEAVAFCKLTTEKLFKFLDMYEALRDNLSPIDSIFPEECAKEIRTEMTTCRCR